MSASFELGLKQPELRTHVQSETPSPQMKTHVQPNTPQKMKTHYQPTTPKVRPKIPTVDEMETWDEGSLLKWIQEIRPNILVGDELNKFNNSNIDGLVFLASNVDIFHRCGLSLGHSVSLNDLVDKVKSKFITST